MHYHIGQRTYKLRVPIHESYDSCDITEFKDLQLTKDDVRWILLQIKELKIRGLK